MVLFAHRGQTHDKIQREGIMKTLQAFRQGTLAGLSIGSSTVGNPSDWQQVLVDNLNQVGAYGVPIEGLQHIWANAGTSAFFINQTPLRMSFGMLQGAVTKSIGVSLDDGVLFEGSLPLIPRSSHTMWVRFAFRGPAEPRLVGGKEILVE